MLLQSTNEGTEVQDAIDWPTVIRGRGFLNQDLLMCVAHSPLTQQSTVRPATIADKVTRKKVVPTRHPRALALTGQAPVTGTVGEKEPGARKQSVFTECWVLKMEEGVNLTRGFVKKAIECRRW